MGLTNVVPQPRLKIMISHIGVKHCCFLIQFCMCAIFSLSLLYSIRLCLFHTQCWKQNLFGSIKKGSLFYQLEEDFSINIKVDPRLCPSFTCWPHCMFDFDTPAAHGGGGGWRGQASAWEKIEGKKKKPTLAHPGLPARWQSPQISRWQTGVKRLLLW